MHARAGGEICWRNDCFAHWLVVAGSDFRLPPLCEQGLLRFPLRDIGAFPLRVEAMCRSRGHQHERALAVRRSSHNSSPTTDLADDSLERIICLDLPPVIAGKRKIGERFLAAAFHENRGCMDRDLQQTGFKGNATYLSRSVVSAEV